MRRKHKDFKKLIGYSMTMGGTSLIAAKLPVPAKAPVQAVATAGAPFVAPMAAVTGAGMVVRSLKKLNPKKLRRGYK